ncbi:hypothetical protein X773_04280 [Mesorhizobium sp. LSJC285A00]|nr:hypothetical protein X773_04280 [Mesorhizobium sp. LSJC285A00]ESW89763.1 hypothetical protein X770_13660 [Mesorhizobium sp. LSJC269B00]ESY20254.1 hypothetical protein X751_14040 [Mesorhizobium sp. LNJC395A00]
MEFLEPAAQQCPEPVGQAFLLAEIDDMQRAAGRECRKGC